MKSINMKKEELIKDKVYTAVVGGVVWIGHFDHINKDIVYSLGCMSVNPINVCGRNGMVLAWMTSYGEIRESYPEEIELLLSQFPEEHPLHSIVNISKSINYEIY